MPGGWGGVSLWCKRWQWDSSCIGGIGLENLLQLVVIRKTRSAIFWERLHML